MFKLADIYLFLFLLVMSIIDVKKRKIPIGLLLVGGITSVLISSAINRPSVKEQVFGIMVGGFFLVISKVTGEGVGYGDSILILIISLCIGGTKTIITFLTACILLLVWAAGILIHNRKVNRRFRLPFYPFLTAGYLMGIIL